MRYSLSKLTLFRGSLVISVCNVKFNNERPVKLDYYDCRDCNKIENHEGADTKSSDNEYLARITKSMHKEIIFKQNDSLARFKFNWSNTTVDLK